MLKSSAHVRIMGAEKPVMTSGTTDVFTHVTYINIGYSPFGPLAHMGYMIWMKHAGTLLLR